MPIEVFSTDEKAAMPERVTVTLSKAELLATCKALVSMRIDDPLRPDAKSAFTRLIAAAQTNVAA